MLHQSGPNSSAIDRYVVLEYLAEGGMGAIYLGKKQGAGGFEKQVVLKQLLPEFTRQPEFIELFLREARLSATLDHANIIHTIDLVTAGEDYFIVMEYLDGADLRSLLRLAKLRRKPLSAAAAMYIAREMLSALSYAHNKIGPDGRPLSLIHRDISPSNILISGNGEVKLTDFGIAKASTHNSVFYRVKGKVGYMSPEQARSEPLDARSDLYSLAVCLYEMIVGERLFVNAGLTTSADEMYGSPIPLVSRKVAGLPADLDKLMLKALAVDPNSRFQSAGEFQDALLRCAHKHGLLISAPELADHLRDVCGPPGNWRHSDAAKEEFGAPQNEGTEQIDLAGLSEEDILSLDRGGIPTRSPQKRSKTGIVRLPELKELELTSMINLAEMESGAVNAGAEPLFDVDNLAGEVAFNAKKQALLDDPYADDDEEEEDLLDRSRPMPLSADPSLHTPAPEFVRPIPLRRSFLQGRRLLILSVILLAGAGTAAAIGLRERPLPPAATHSR